MNDSYTRHECGITTFVPSRASRIVDALVLMASYALVALKLYLVYRALAL